MRRVAVPEPEKPLEKSSPNPLELERDALVREISRAAVRLEKRVKAVETDLVKIDEASATASQASWLVAAAAKAKRGATSLTISDWSSGEERKIVFPLDPAKTAKEQVDAMFQKARRLKAGRPIAEKRRNEASAAAAELRGLLDELAALSLGDANAEESLERVLARAAKIAPREIRREIPVAKKKRQQEKLPPYRAFRGHGDIAIWVGRGAARNDELTFDFAKPHHAWLHAKDDAGAHVVVCVKKGAEMTAEQLVDAAHLAAHFSKAREERIADVSYTYRRYVRKPRKSPPGMVTVDREKVITVRIEPDRLAKLLASEEA